MAVDAQGNGDQHLLAGEVFLEPLVRMTAAWNQVMLSGAALGDSATEIARVLHSRFCVTLGHEKNHDCEHRCARNVLTSESFNGDVDSVERVFLSFVLIARRLGGGGDVQHGGRLFATKATIRGSSGKGDQRELLSGG